MSEDNPKAFNPRGLPRIPLKLKVNMEFEKFSGFISDYSENISEGGMFIKTTDPRPIGSVFSLEFKLKDDYKLIQGWGEVVWVREKAEGEKSPAGMGIKFLDIDPASRDLIRNIIRIHKKDPSGTDIHPFDFMNKDAPASQETEAPKGDLAELAKEVFKEEESGLEGHGDVEVKVDDIFKDIKSEIDLASQSSESSPPKSPDLTALEDNSSRSAPKTVQPAPKANKDSKESELRLDAEASAKESSSFIDEVFGKESLSKSSPAKKAKIDAAMDNDNAEKDPYRKVSWFTTPSNILVLLMLITALAFAVMFYDKIINTAMLIKTYIAEKKPQVKKPVKSQVAKREVKKEGDTAIKPLADAVQDRPHVETPLAKETAKAKTPLPSPSPSATKALEDIKAKPAPYQKPAPNQITGVKLTPYQSGAVKVDFEFQIRPSNDSVSREVLKSPPRYLIKVAGVDRLYKRRQFTLVNDNLKSIRMGLHKNPDEIHIVFDLAGGIDEGRLRFSLTDKGFALTVMPVK